MDIRILDANYRVRQLRGRTPETTLAQAVQKTAPSARLVKRQGVWKLASEPGLLPSNLSRGRLVTGWHNSKGQIMTFVNYPGLGWTPEWVAATAVFGKYDRILCVCLPQTHSKKQRATVLREQRNEHRRNNPHLG